MRSAPILPSSGSSRRSDAGASRSCSTLSPIRATSGYPEVARACVAALGAQLRMLKAQILEFDRQIMAWHRSNETSKRLDEIPGVGPALATALVASVADPKGLPVRTELLGLDRTGTEAALERRQGQARQ